MDFHPFIHCARQRMGSDLKHWFVPDSSEARGWGKEIFKFFTGALFVGSRFEAMDTERLLRLLTTEQLRV